MRRIIGKIIERVARPACRSGDRARNETGMAMDRNRVAMAGMLGFGSMVAPCPNDAAAAPGAFLPEARWTAISSTAMAITGDIRTAPGRIELAGHAVPLERVATLEGHDLAHAASLIPVNLSADTSAALFRGRVAGDTRFLNRNRLCGSQETDWFLVVLSSSGLSLAMFTGDSRPDLSPDAIAHTTALCGTYGYARR